MAGRQNLAMCNENHPGADITREQWEFIQAIEAYQRRFRRRYPTWREVLHVALCLGYRRTAPPMPLERLPVEDWPLPTPHSPTVAVSESLTAPPNPEGLGEGSQGFSHPPLIRLPSATHLSEHLVPVQRSPLAPACLNTEPERPRSDSAGHP